MTEPKRYDLVLGTVRSLAYMAPSDHGEWVPWVDYRAQAARIEEQRIEIEDSIDTANYWMRRCWEAQRELREERKTSP